MSVGLIIGTGITLGFVHVLTGPDHLSALATLSSTSETAPQAFWLGVRWGIGHSIGLLLVGGIAIAVLPPSSDIEIPEAVTMVFESIVGVFMIFLGFYGIFLVFHNKKDYDDDGCTTEDERLSLQQQSDGVELSPRVSSNSQKDKKQTDTFHDEEDQPEIAPPIDIVDNDRNWLSSLCSKLSTGSIALTAGVVHGLAGPGGVLGVIPAVQLRDALLSSIYLITFCLTSTLVMGLFATTYGYISRQLSSTSSEW
eukprot:CAMPEP_0178895596 /NCGR_PEP_ID=MMETSP0786-20121207/680_1 /TAXON_ID=186022 /ORGANISM="Thalassionema frauenfeldii, Strain CCMP 1798" /LENGTH=252 /DNA_ID=CAMNT_0020565855 /DNA_START=40 /DNA_END=795 /DNA_ORIENTATION=+